MEEPQDRQIDSRPGPASAEDGPVPRVVASTGEAAASWFHEFTGAGIANPHTRSAYSRALERFLAWCSDEDLAALQEIAPSTVEAYLRQHRGSEATVRQHLAALRLFFQGLVGRGLIGANPASSIRAPRSAAAGVGRGRAPTLTPGQTRAFLETIDTQTVVGLRDRAILGVMVYAFARVGSVVGLTGDDYLQRDGRRWLRLRRWTGAQHEVPLHRAVEGYLEAYLERAPVTDARGSLFRTASRRRARAGAPLTRTDVLRMVKRRARTAGLPARISCHTFRASGIAAYLENGGALERAQLMAGHKSARSTRLYSPALVQVSPAEIDRINL